jgi:hypothetical protein
MSRLLALTAFILGLGGCVPGSREPLVLPEPACVAEYLEIAPGYELGMDGCGNTWVKLPDGCYVMDDSLQMLIPIVCPAPGDTLAAAPVDSLR